jgi:hypothetical protein
MANQSSNKANKGNPASHRMSNPRNKAYRALCWARQEKRKDARRKAQAEREARNKKRGWTAWEMAKGERHARRH